MPELGESVMEGTIIQWHKAQGDAVKAGDILLEVDTDKVTTEIESPADGILLQITAQNGATIDVGATVGIIGNAGETPEAAPVSVAKPTAAPIVTPAARPTAPPLKSPASDAYISPVVGRMLAHHGLDIAQISGTGKNGRVSKKDVLAHIKQRESVQAAPVQAPAGLTPTAEAHDLLAVSPMRRAIADHMVRSVQTSPHVNAIIELDLSAISKHRSANKAAFANDGVKLTYTAYFMVAVAQALKTHRIINSSWTDAGIQLHPNVNLGMATALGEKGLIVPVVKDASDLNLLGMARSIGDLANRARDNALRPDEVRGGTFTLTNYGANRASLLATPIINQPQAAIMGLGKIERRPVVRELAGEEVIVARTMCYVSLTYDHRLIDGTAASAFLLDVTNAIENWPKHDPKTAS